MRFPPMVPQNQYDRVVGLVYNKSLSTNASELISKLSPPNFDTNDMTARSFVSTWLSGPLEVLFPRECLVCTRPIKGASLCFRCVPSTVSLALSRCPRCFGEGLGPSESACPACEAFALPVDRIRYLWEYEGLARDFIRAMKYRPSPYLAYRAGELLAESLPALFGDESWDRVIPVPSSPGMLKKRLFHPCAEMSRAMHRYARGFTIRNALRHQGTRGPQARRSHSERLRGLKRVFRVSNVREIAGKRILLVEDVITTGATVAAAAHVLYQAGAHSVDVVALAEARVWRRFRSRIFTLFKPESDRISGVRGYHSVVPLRHDGRRLSNKSRCGTHSIS